MIKKLCDRCGNERFPIHQNAIDSFEVSLAKKRQDPKLNSRGVVDGQWRVRVCTVNSALCRSCCAQVLKEGLADSFAHEGDFAPEVYELVQTPEEAKVYRFNNHAEYEIATGQYSRDVYSMSFMVYTALEEVGQDPPIIRFWKRFIPEQAELKRKGLPYFEINERFVPERLRCLLEKSKALVESNQGSK